MTETFGPHGVEPLGTRLPPEKAGAFARAIPGVSHHADVTGVAVATAVQGPGGVTVHTRSVCR